MNSNHYNRNRSQMNGKFTDLDDEVTSLANNRIDKNDNKNGSSCVSSPQDNKLTSQDETRKSRNTTNTVAGGQNSRESVDEQEQFEDEKRKRRCLQVCSKANRKRIKRPLPCLFAWMLLLSSTGAYYCLVTPQLYETINDMTSWLVVIVIQSVLFFNCVLNFSIAILRDPGLFRKFVILPDDPNYNDDTKSPLYKDIFIKSAKVKIKWCSTCNFYRPPRCSHCSICDSCIDHFDHHCPWLNNCVGRRNYRFFFQFLLFLCLHMCAIFASCLLVVLTTSHTIQPSVITSICLMGLCGLLIFPIGGLFAFHIVLVSKGRTTNEHVTGKYKGANFFSRGCCANILQLFCGSLTPRYTKNRVKGQKNVKKKSRATKDDNLNSGENIEFVQIDSMKRKGDSKDQIQIVNEQHSSELLDLVLKNKKSHSDQLPNSNSNNMIYKSTPLRINDSASSLAAMDASDEEVDELTGDRKVSAYNENEEKSFSSSMLNKTSGSRQHHLLNNNNNNSSFDSNRLPIINSR